MQKNKCIDYIDNNNLTVFAVNESKAKNISLNDIVFIEIKGRKTRLITVNGEYISDEKIDYWEEKLKQTFFYRVHKSYIINIKHVTDYTRASVILTEKFIVPIAYRKQTDFRHASAYKKQVVSSLPALDLLHQIPLFDDTGIKRKEDVMPRKRQNKIAFYLNDEEYARLLELEEKLKINRSTLFRYLIWHQQITVPPENFNELIIELKRIGNNLNQLARAANAKGFLNGNELREELYALRKCETDLQKAFPIKRR